MHFQVKSILKNITRNILYMFFTTHKLQPQFLSNIYLNLTTTCNRIFLKFIFLKPQKKKKKTHLPANCCGNFCIGHLENN
jgi:hypothetical protein